MSVIIASSQKCSPHPANKHKKPVRASIGHLAISPSFSIALSLSPSGNKPLTTVTSSSGKGYRMCLCMRVPAVYKARAPTRKASRPYRSHFARSRANFRLLQFPRASCIFHPRCTEKSRGSYCDWLLFRLTDRNGYFNRVFAGKKHS